MKSTNQALRSITAASVLALTSLSASAGDIPLFNTAYPTPSSACATFGNLVSCSTAVLEYLASVPYSGYASPYTFNTAQGAIKDTIVLTTNNGQILENSDLLPSGSEDAFSSQNGGNRYFYTGEVDKQGNSNDPANNNPLFGDTFFSWDTSLSGLIDKLTFDNAFHQMLIGFDFSQSQNNTATLPIWSLITVRDVDGNKSNIYFETQALNPKDIFADPTAFHSTKTFDGSAVTTPGALDFAMTVGAVCVVNQYQSYPSPDGTTCPQGGTLVGTNRGQNELEFINYLPGLDLNDLLDKGYDTISVQVWMGCFNTGDKSGPALLNGGSIGPCDTAGYGDIFIVAGAAEQKIPEPGALMLTSLGLILLTAALRRRKTTMRT